MVLLKDSGAFARLSPTPGRKPATETYVILRRAGVGNTFVSVL